MGLKELEAELRASNSKEVADQLAAYLKLHYRVSKQFGDQIHDLMDQIDKILRQIDMEKLTTVGRVELQRVVYVNTCYRQAIQRMNRLEN